MQGLLELANIPYVGAGVLASAVGMDKAVMKVLFAARGLPVCPYRVVLRHDWETRPRRDRRRARDGAEVPDVRQAGEPRLERRHLEGEGRRRPRATRWRWRAASTARSSSRPPCRTRARSNARCSATTRRRRRCPARSSRRASSTTTSPSTSTRDRRRHSGGPAARRPPSRSSELSIEAFKAIDGAGMSRVDFLLVARQRQDLPERGQHHPRLHHHQHVSRSCGQRLRPRYPALLDRLIALALERHAEKQQLRTSLT